MPGWDREGATGESGQERQERGRERERERERERDAHATASHLFANPPVWFTRPVIRWRYKWLSHFDSRENARDPPRGSPCRKHR
jgi:hypothetical protein